MVGLGAYNNQYYLSVNHFTTTDFFFIASIISWYSASVR